MKKIIIGIVLGVLYIASLGLVFGKMSGVSKQIKTHSYIKVKAEKMCDKLCIALADDMLSETKGKIVFELDGLQETEFNNGDYVVYVKGDTKLVFSRITLVYLIQHENYTYSTIRSRLMANLELERGKIYGWINKDVDQIINQAPMFKTN